MPRARLLLDYVLVCSSRFGVQWIQVPIDAMCCDDPYGTSCFFPFIGQGKARVTVEEKEEKEKEKKSSRIVGSFFSFTRVPPTLYTSIGIAPCRGPICHWHHAQALSLGCGAPLHPGGHHGELTCLLVLVQGLGRTALVRPTLFLM